MLLSRIDFPRDDDDEEEEEAYRGPRYVTLSYDRNVKITVPEGHFLETNFSKYKDDEEMFNFFQKYKQLLQTGPGSQNRPIKDEKERQIFEQFHSDYFLVRNAQPHVKAILKKQQPEFHDLRTLHNDRTLADEELKDAFANNPAKLQAIARNPKMRRKMFRYLF